MISKDELKAQSHELTIERVENLCEDLDEASRVIQALAALIAGWEHLPAVPAELQKRAEKFGADWSG